MILTFLGEGYECARAEKGADWIKLYGAAGDCTVVFTGISDFDGYALSGGAFEAPPPTQEERLAAAEEAILGLIMGV